ncbi:MAG TPA: PspA/IM30 family protein [Bacillota bacterium]|nr:PspA/IM30 family protein [Bacillota bacterium]
MGVLTRMKNIIMAETNGFLEKIEKPIYLLEQSIQVVEENLAKGQKALAEQIYLEKKQTILIGQVQDMIEKRTRQAKLATQQGEETIAKIALQEKIVQEEKLEIYERQLETMKAQTASISEQIFSLREKLDEFKHRKLLLLSKLNATQSLNQLQDQSVFFQTDNVAKGFVRVEEQILRLESELEAKKQSTTFLNKNNYYLDPSMQDRVEEELAKLKNN